MRDEATRLPLRDVKAMLSAALGPKYVAPLSEQRLRDAYRAWLIVATSEGRDRARVRSVMVRAGLWSPLLWQGCRTGGPREQSAP